MKQITLNKKRPVKTALGKLLLLATLLFTLTTQAQVTIGSGAEPNPDALLDLKENPADSSSTKGLVLPRVALQLTTLSAPLSAHVEGMFVYNTATAGDVTPGIYYNDGTKWINYLFPQQFYMPSIVLPTDPSTLPGSDYTYSGTTFSVNLYNLYKGQYGLSSSATSQRSPDSPDLKIFNVDQLYYYITYFDNAVFSNVQVGATGILTYQLVSGYTISEKTFMNILFREK